MPPRTAGAIKSCRNVGTTRLASPNDREGSGQPEQMRAGRSTYTSFLNFTDTFHLDACLKLRLLSVTAVSQESRRSTKYVNQWLNLSNKAKTKIKNHALLTLGSSSQTAGTFASQVIAAITAIELLINQWEISSESCDQLHLQVNSASHIIHNHNTWKEEPSQEAHLSVIHALYKSVEFVHNNFKHKVKMKSTGQV
ncbi:hypothetical protein B0H14DRAFT_3158494 [Mycena olivaceomarginata]|nr:hypothetical protein B0H14DRAFT_3158494 [Mycena olivaceomarginata]